MDKFLGQDTPEQERWQFLQDNADAVEKNRLHAPVHPRRTSSEERNLGRGFNHHQRCGD